MTRALIFCDTTAPGGVDAYTVQLAIAARRKGYDVRVAIDTSEGADRLAGLLSAADLPPHRAALHKRYSEEERAAAVDALFDEFAPDLVHVVLPAPWAGLVPRERAMARGLPWVATEQLVDASFTLAPELKERLEQLYRAAPHIAVSHANRKVLVEHFGLPGKHLHVIPNNVDIDRFTPASPIRRETARAKLGLCDETVFLTVARLDPQKGIDILLKAAALTPAGNWRLLIAGIGPDEAMLRAQADELHVSDRVQWLGWREDTPELLAAADLFVLSSRFEGQPIALLEAMAAGAPVLATAVSGTPEALRFGALGTLVPSEAPGRLAAALTAFLKGELPNRCGAARLQVLQEHNAKVNLARTLALWDAVLAKR
jgi:glycosyltransferase involved in cell wall biosynthesis